MLRVPGLGHGSPSGLNGVFSPPPPTKNASGNVGPGTAVKPKAGAFFCYGFCITDLLGMIWLYMSLCVYI